MKLDEQIRQLQRSIQQTEDSLELALRPQKYQPSAEVLPPLAKVQELLNHSASEQEREQRVQMLRDAIAESKRELEALQKQWAQLEKSAGQGMARVQELASKLNAVEEKRAAEVAAIVDELVKVREQYRSDWRSVYGGNEQLVLPYAANGNISSGVAYTILRAEQRGHTVHVITIENWRDWQRQQESMKMLNGARRAS